MAVRTNREQRKRDVTALFRFALARYTDRLAGQILPLLQKDVDDGAIDLFDLEKMEARVKDYVLSLGAREVKARGPVLKP